MTRHLIEITDPELLDGEELPGHNYAEKKKWLIVSFINYILSKFKIKNGTQG